MEFQKELPEYVPFALAPSYWDETVVHYSCRSGNSKSFMYLFALFIPLAVLLLVGVTSMGFWTTPSSGRYRGIPIGMAFLGALFVIGVFVWASYKKRQKRYVHVGLLSMQLHFFKGKVCIAEPSLGCVTILKLQLKDGAGRFGKEVFAVAAVGETHGMFLGAFVTEEAANKFLQITVGETGLPILKERSIELPETIGFVRFFANDQRTIEMRKSKNRIQ